MLEKNHFEQVFQSEQKLLSPLVIRAIEKMTSICNNENNKSKRLTPKIHLKSLDGFKYPELEPVTDTVAQVNVAGLSHLHLLNVPQESLYKPSHQVEVY